jgi:hypothetical protein
MKKVIRLTEDDLTRLVKRVIKEQENFSFLENEYVKKYLQDGYKIVPKITLPDGDYTKWGSGYSIELYNQDGETDTGYVIITKDGIRGMWSGNPINVVGGTIPEESVYKILYKPTVPAKK